MEEITKKFYEDKVQIKWMYYANIILFLGSVYFVFSKPSEIASWICFGWFLIQVIGAKNSLKNKNSYVEISSEFLKIENKNFFWNNIQSISIIAPISKKFNTIFRVKLKTMEKDFSMGAFTDKDREGLFREIEKYKKIQFIRYDRYGKNSSAKNGFRVVLILALLVLFSPLIAFIFDYLFSLYLF